MKEIDYAAPETVEEAVELLVEKGDRARPLAGGTDLIVQLREHRRSLDLVVDIKHIPEVMDLSFDPTTGLHLGAAVSCSRIAADPVVIEKYQGLCDAALLIGGIQIKSRASMGGNLCNGSPAGDTIPALIACSAVALIAGPEGTREVPVEQFCTGPGKTILKPGEFLVNLRLPPPPPRTASHYMRFIPRNEMDIAVVGVGTSVTLDESKTRCVASRVSLGAVAATPLLVTDAAAALVNGSVTDDHIAQAAALAQAAAKPISDMRGDAEYRRHLVGVLVKRSLKAAFDRAKGA